MAVTASVDPSGSEHLCWSVMQVNQRSYDCNKLLLRATSVIKAYRKEMLGRESYAYLGRPSCTVTCPEATCRQEYIVYLESEDSETAARNSLGHRLKHDHDTGKPHRDAFYIP